MSSLDQVTIPQILAALATLGTVLRLITQNRDRVKRLLRVPGTAHSIEHEIAVLVPLCVALNLAGGAYGYGSKSEVWLDMVGTFLAAMILGPWWGAATGLLSNVSMAALFDKDVFFPFAVVQVLGAVYWGYIARLSLSSQLLSVGRANVGSFAVAVVLLGVGAGVVTGISSAWVKLIVINGVPAGSAVTSLAEVATPKILTEIASKVATVVIGALLLRSLFPIFVRDRVRDPRHSGLLPVSLLLVASVFYGYRLLKPSLEAGASDMQLIAQGAWVVLLPLLGLFDEVRLTRSSGDLRSHRDERIEIFDQLTEVRRESDGAFSMAAVISILLGFVCVVLYEGGQAQPVGQLAPIVALVLLVTWLFEIAARHNRLDQRLVLAGPGGATETGRAASVPPTADTSPASHSEPGGIGPSQGP